MVCGPSHEGKTKKKTAKCWRTAGFSGESVCARANRFRWHLDISIPTAQLSEFIPSWKRFSVVSLQHARIGGDNPSIQANTQGLTPCQGYLRFSIQNQCNMLRVLGSSLRFPGQSAVVCVSHLVQQFFLQLLTGRGLKCLQD